MHHGLQSTALGPALLFSLIHGLSPSTLAFLHILEPDLSNRRASSPALPSTLLLRPQSSDHFHVVASTQHRSLSYPAWWPPTGLLLAYFTVPHYRAIFLFLCLLLIFTVVLYAPPGQLFWFLPCLIPNNAPNIISNTKITSTHMCWMNEWIMHYLFIHPKQKVGGKTSCKRQ